LAIREGVELGDGQVVEKKIAANMAVPRLEIEACFRIKDAISAALEAP